MNMQKKKSCEKRSLQSAHRK